MTVNDLAKKRKTLGLDQATFARRMGWYKETLIYVEGEKIGLTQEDFQRYQTVLNEVEQEKNREEVSGVV